MGDLLLGQLAHVGVVFQFDQFLGVIQFPLQGLILAIGLYQLLDLGLLLSVLGDLDVIGYHLRIGHQLVQFFVPFFYQFYLVKHTPTSHCESYAPSYGKTRGASRLCAGKTVARDFCPRGLWRRRPEGVCLTGLLGCYMRKVVSETWPASPLRKHQPEGRAYLQ